MDPQARPAFSGSRCCIKRLLTLAGWVFLTWSSTVRASDALPVAVGTFHQQVATAFTERDGLPGDDVRAIVATAEGQVYAGTDRGLARFSDHRFAPVPGLSQEPVHALALKDHQLYVSQGPRALFRLDLTAGEEIHPLPPLPQDGRSVPRTLAVGEDGQVLYVGLRDGLWRMRLPAGSRESISALSPDDGLNPLLGPPGAMREVRDLAVAPADHGAVAVAAHAGLFLRPSGRESWRRLFPRQGNKSWAPVEVQAVSFDPQGRLWFASPQGIGGYDFKTARWTLYDAGRGLPYNDLTALVPGLPDPLRPGAPELWLGTSLGAARLHGDAWEYRQGRRWLPDDEVRALSVDGAGTVWIATAGGVGRIEHRPMTLAAKARFYEDEIDRYHRRTPYGFVDWVRLVRPGDKSQWVQRDSDNDGLWTGMYGAGECFAYAATGDPAARKRATQAFEALRKLSQVPRGGTHPAPPGFIARTLLPTQGPDPNVGRLERDRARKAEHDGLWKLIDPRWPVSADGKWYWKTDASSDELDGHFFLYAQYYDLVAESEEEKARVREVVVGIVDHLLAHDLSLVDHDGEPTRWAVFGPQKLNHDRDWWGERGLNSLSVLSYLAVAEHMTGHGRYAAAAQELIRDHAYAANARVPKIHSGPGTGNQSDDEMAFMSFYNLLKYEPDPHLTEIWAHSFYRYWRREQDERNPLFHFLFAAVARGRIYPDPFGDVPLDPDGDWLKDSVDTLKRFPLDRISWAHRNQHRQDLVFFSDPDRRRGRGRDGKVLPVDERFFEHWNHDPWVLDTGDEGHRLADGAVFLLPYYLGLYHGFLQPEEHDEE